jgi:hypothetical protein
MPRRTLALLVCFTLSACGGSSDDGGGGGGSPPVNLINFQPASDIVGQTLATTGAANDGGATGQVGLDRPQGHMGNGSFYVPDRDNHRVMGWNAIPTGLGEPADFVIGQVDFNGSTSGLSAGQLDSPDACWVASNALFVADAGNNRVLVYSPVPTSNAPASFALGQATLGTETAALTQAGLNFPSDVCVASNRIVVADSTNNRVMIWNGIPAANGASAQIVVGQPDFTTGTPGLSAVKMSGPSGVWTDGTRLLVADSNNNRVLVWQTFPTSNGQPADFVIGQPDFATGTFGTGAQGLNNPIAVASNGAQVFVADQSNNRVLVFPFPNASNAAATGVLGQSNFTNVAANDDDQDGLSDAGPTARTMSFPEGVTVVGNQVFVADAGNNRVLVFTGS